VGSGIIRFKGDLERAGTLCLDTMVSVYHLEDLRPYSDLTSSLIDLLTDSRVRAIMSVITVTEILARPYALGALDGVAQAKKYLAGLPNTSVIPVDYETARLAAELRGRYRLRTPDSLVLATGVLHEAKALVTNDMAFKDVSIKGISVMLLDSYVNA